MTAGTRPASQDSNPYRFSTSGGCRQLDSYPTPGLKVAGALFQVETNPTRLGTFNIRLLQKLLVVEAKRGPAQASV